MQTITPTSLPPGPGNCSNQLRAKHAAEVRAVAAWMEGIVNDLGFAPGSRSWCYLLEDAHIITKGEFKKAETWIANNRKRLGADGLPLIPWRLIGKDDSRKITGFDAYDEEATPAEYINRLIRNMTTEARAYWPASYWKFQKRFPIIWAEKGDLIKLFEPALPRAVLRFSGKGWADLNSRADCLGRIAWARSKGLQPVILYCGDHDPAGLQISDKIRKTLHDIEEAVRAEWVESCIAKGHVAALTRQARRLFDVESLEIVRFGLNEDFIEDNDLLWTDGLETSSGGDLADPNHQDHDKPYVQDYLERYGERKVEANALIVRPEEARELMEDTLYQYLSAEGEEQWNAENSRASDEASECIEHFIKMITFIDSQGWLYSGHKLAEAAQTHRDKQQGQLPPAIDIDINDQ